MSLQPSSDIAKQAGRVAVLMGGVSAEREVSLNSGNAVHQALLAAGVDAVAVDVQQDPVRQLLELNADRVFNVLHGGMGEDGRIRAILDGIGIPCTGCGVTAASLTMDKVLTKKVLLSSDIPTPVYHALHSAADCARLIETDALPVFVKPAREGSSVGMTPVHQAEDLLPAWQRARQFGQVFAEQFITGGEYTASFLGDTVLPLIKLETPREFYDYEAKYKSDDTIYLCPAPLAADKTAEIKELVSKTIKATGVTGWGRVDLMLDDEEKVWIIEVNSVPGMTDHSLVPMAAREAGLDMPSLVLKILELSMQEGG